MHKCVSYELHRSSLCLGSHFKMQKKCIEDPHSCFKLVKAKRHLAILPKYIGDANKGIREQLDAKLNLYTPSFNGVLVAYSNIRRLQSSATIIGSQPYLHIYIKGDFIIFQPSEGSTLRGVVNKVGRDYVGCLVHGAYNASLAIRRQDGRLVTRVDPYIGQEFLFKVVRFFSQSGVLSIRGRFFDGSFDMEPSAGGAATLETDTYDGPDLHDANGSHSVPPEVTAVADVRPEITTESLLDDGPLGRHKQKKKKKKKEKRREERGEEGVDGERETEADASAAVLVNGRTTETEGTEGEGHAHRKKRKRQHHDEIADHVTSAQSGAGHVVLADEVDQRDEEERKRKKKKKKKEKSRDRDLEDT